VLVVDHPGRQPEIPDHPARVPVLLASGRARCHLALSVGRRVAGDVPSSVVTGVGVDPGFKFTGISVFETIPTGRVSLVAIEVRHRGQLFHKKLQQLFSNGWGSES